MFITLYRADDVMGKLWDIFVFKLLSYFNYLIITLVNYSNIVYYSNVYIFIFNIFDQNYPLSVTKQ